MKTFKRILAFALCLVITMSIVSIGAEAVSVSTTSTNYGYMVPTDSKFSKTVSTVKLYGTHDYLNFYIDSEYDNKYFFYEIYADKNYTKLVAGDFVFCENSGVYTWSPLITLKGVFKSGTYYCITYSASMDSNGNAKLSTSSIRQFKLIVDRTTAFSKQVVVLKNVKNTVNGPQISWYKQSNMASKYAIYRRSISGTKWTRVGTVGSSTLTFTDTSVKHTNGKYVYTVKALDKNGNGSRYQFSGLTCLYAKTPVVQSVLTTADNKIQIMWESTNKNAYYRIYRKTNGGSWETIKKLHRGTSYIDDKTVTGNNYQYTVRAFINTANGTAVSSFYSGKGIDFIGAPEILPSVRVENGVQVSWKAVSGAIAYTIYRRPFDRSEKWAKLDQVTADMCTFVDETAEDNASYIYTVRSEGVTARGSYLSTSGEYVVMKAPEALRAEVKGESLNLYWSNVPNATGYEVYLQNNAGEWDLLSKVGGVCKYNFIPDRTGELKFRVRGLYKNLNKGEYSEDFGFEFYPAFVNFSYENRVAGNYLSWKPNAVAEKYNVYRAVVDNESEITYELIETFTPPYNGKKLEYIDSSVEDGVIYQYIVKGVYNGVEQPVGSKAQLSRLSESAINRQEDVKFIQEQYSREVEITVAEENVKYTILGYDHVKKEWKTLYYQKFDGVLTIMGYNLANADENGEYLISVVYEIDGIKTAIDANLHKGSFYYGGYGDVEPKITADGVKLTWQAVENAQKYIIEYTNESTGETGIIEKANDNSDTYSALLKTDVYAEKGIEMKITIDAVMEDNQYNRYFVSVETRHVPKLFKAQSQKSSSIRVYWEYDDDVYSDYFYVYRKAKGETKWTYLKGSINYIYRIETINGVTYASYEDTSAKDGVEYTYTVRQGHTARSSDNNFYLMSYFDENGVSAKSLSTPALSSATRSSNGITVKWGEVTGADGYYVYRKTAGSGWSRIGKVENGSDSSFKDTTAKSGTTYYYTVKAYSGSSTSGYVKNGIKCS